MSDFMKKPCKNCPFRHDVKPFLTASRGEELAYSTENPCNEFYCHTTTDSVDTDEGSETVCGERTKICAGFLTMQVAASGEHIEGFEPSFELVYEDSMHMTDVYEELGR